MGRKLWLWKEMGGLWESFIVVLRGMGDGRGMGRVKLGVGGKRKENGRGIIVISGFDDGRGMGKENM